MLSFDDFMPAKEPKTLHKINTVKARFKDCLYSKQLLSFC